MRIEKSIFITLSGILLVGASTTAFAGSFGAECGGNAVCGSAVSPRLMAYEGVRSNRCNQGPVARPMMARPAMPVADCNANVVNHGPAADPLAPVHNYSTAPYGHLKTVEYKNTPNVNVTRIYARPDMAPLNAAPTQVSGGCSPASGAYCRAPMPRPVARVPMPRPVAQAPMPRPTMRAPMPRPVMVPRPMMRPPVVARPLQVRTGAGYNASNFAPRQIGDNVLTPGIAHIPTSIVDRSPITHIDGVPQQQVRSVTTLRGAQAARPTAPHGGNVIGHVSGGSYTYQPQGSSDYWEKTSGPTVVDGLPATQILCRREGTRPAPVTVNISRPVIGVPRPVPTPVAVPTRTAGACAPGITTHAPMMHPPMPAHPMPARPSSGWTY